MLTSAEILHSAREYSLRLPVALTRYSRQLLRQSTLPQGISTVPRPSTMRTTGSRSSPGVASTRHVLPFLRVLPAVTKDRHAQIVHRLDLDHIARPDSAPAAIPGTMGLPA